MFLVYVLNQIVNNYYRKIKLKGKLKLGSNKNLFESSSSHEIEFKALDSDNDKESQLISDPNEENKYQSEISNLNFHYQDINMSKSSSEISDYSKESLMSKWSNNWNQANLGYEGIHPSQHGLNMNNISNFEELNPEFHKSPIFYDFRLHGTSSFGLRSQNILNKGKDIFNPADNISMVNSMSNLLMDPKFICTTKPSEGTNGTNPEDPYEYLREYYKTSFFPFSNDMLKDLVGQIDIYVQLLLQTLLSAKDVNQQYFKT